MDSHTSQRNVKPAAMGIKVRKGRNAELEKKQLLGKVDSLSPRGEAGNALGQANVGLDEAKLIVAVIL